MRFELISETLLIISGIGLLYLIFRKIPILNKLPESAEEDFNFREIISNLNGKIKTLSVFKSFSYEIFLQKMLAKVRILTMKTENKTFTWLQQLKERANKKNKPAGKDNYWEEVGKIKKKK